jgi:hypothetical protein
VSDITSRNQDESDRPEGRLPLLTGAGEGLGFDVLVRLRKMEEIGIDWNNFSYKGLSGTSACHAESFTRTVRSIFSGSCKQEN